MIPNENFIAAYFQGTFFGGDRPNYLNYGSIGFAIGHEMTHGFDDMGRFFISTHLHFYLFLL